MSNSETQVLVVNSSINSTESNSYAIAETLLGTLKQKHNVFETRRDLAQLPLPHLSLEEMATWMSDSDSLDEHQQVLESLSDQVITEVENADLLILTVPMYNFGIPSTLKAWIDRVARAGRTFKYTENGPQGLLTGKKVVIVATRGGKYQGTPKDTQTQYLTDFFNFVGITDIEFVYAEGLNMGELDDAVANANEQVKALAEKLAA